MGTLLFDLRDAARGLRRDAGFAATVILTLAVTIGATTAAFSIVNGILLKPLAFPDPSQLVTLREIWKEFADRAPTVPVNERHFEYWREHNQSFQAIAQYIALPANLTSGGPAVEVSVATASGTLFDVLGRFLYSRAMQINVVTMAVILIVACLMNLRRKALA